MKLIHLSDLHLGKTVCGFPMLEDQAYILREILGVIEAEQPQAVLLAGDLYDRPVPSAEAVRLLDDFLFRLTQLGVKLFAVSGNHDSADRVAFASRLLCRSGVYLSPAYDGAAQPTLLRDEYGPVAVHLLPFVKPAQVRRCYPEAEIGSFTDALRVAVENMDVDPDVRNVLVAHQFVTGAERSDSEELSVGGLDNVDAEVFAPFDYVALGHLHGPQSVGRETLRYCGSPLKYSFSEAAQRKSVTVVELGAKGEAPSVRTVALRPLHDLRALRGSYAELMRRDSYAGTATDDYLQITLTDEEDVPDAMRRLQTVYPNLMKLDYDNLRTRSAAQLTGASDAEHLRPEELFEELYEKQNGQPMGPEQRAFARELLERLEESR